MGSTESLSSRYAVYEVHFTCRTRDEIIKARALMALTGTDPWISHGRRRSDTFRGAYRIGEWDFTWIALQHDKIPLLNTQ